MTCSPENNTHALHERLRSKTPKKTTQSCDRGLNKKTASKGPALERRRKEGSQQSQKDDAEQAQRRTYGKEHSSLSFFQSLITSKLNSIIIYYARPCHSTTPNHSAPQVQKKIALITVGQKMDSQSIPADQNSQENPVDWRSKWQNNTN